MIIAAFINGYILLKEMNCMYKVKCTCKVICSYRT